MGSVVPVVGMSCDRGDRILRSGRGRGHAGSVGLGRCDRVADAICDQALLATLSQEGRDDSVASKAIRDCVSSRSRAISPQSSITGWLAVAETGISSPQELLALNGDKGGSITFEELKQVVEKAGNLN